MREILFRGKRIDNGEWVHGCPLFTSVRGAYIISSITKTVKAKNTGEAKMYDMLIESEVVPETIGQYTGLKDKNGVKIFEGDILLVFDRHGKEPLSRTKAYWNDGYWGGKLLEGESFATCYSGFGKCEIIGNIHDKEGTDERD